VPFADHLLFARLAPVAVLNIGGIANLTLIPSGRASDVIAFDTGPGNMVIDGVSAGAGATHDMDGHGAARGKINQAALAELLREPYFARRAPKSTGRELFGVAFAKRVHDLVAKHGGSHDDALATATALTAQSIGEALDRESIHPVSRVLAAGGGTRNPTLMRMIGQAIAPVPLDRTDSFGVPAAFREAIAFAILGAYRFRGEPNTLPSATGASRGVSGGALHLP
jgi:anhydro-N-acetylmuramic acid kinase